MTFQKGHPGYRPRLDLRAARSLAIACREAASDEQVAEWLLAIMAGRDPWARRRQDGTAPVFSIPPDWTHRLAAMKMFLERRDGAPMQAVVLKAELESVIRDERPASVIDVDTLDAAGAAVLRTALRAALASAQEDVDPEEPAE